MTDIVADNVALAIRSNQDLEYINVSSCCISEHGLFAIFNALSDLSSLVQYSYYSCWRDCKCIFSEQDINSYILNLCQCNLPTQDFAQILSSVRKNGFLMYLDVSHNQINQDVACTMSTIILNNPVLKHLDIMQFCQLREEDIKVFADRLEKLATYS